MFEKKTDQVSLISFLSLQTTTVSSFAVNPNHSLKTGQKLISFYFLDFLERITLCRYLNRRFRKQPFLGLLWRSVETPPPPAPPLCFRWRNKRWILAERLPSSSQPRENNGKSESSVECSSVEEAKKKNTECGLWVPMSSLSGRSLWYVLITAWERLSAGAETCWPTRRPEETHTLKHKHTHNPCHILTLCLLRSPHYTEKCTLVFTMVRRIFRVVLTFNKTFKCIMTTVNIIVLIVSVVA